MVKMCWVWQTGEGKQPRLHCRYYKIDLDKKYPQLLVMAPTRELAIQVADACEQFAKNLKVSILLPFMAVNVMIFNYAH